MRTVLLTVLALLLPLLTGGPGATAAASRPARPSPGFVGLTTARGHELGIARLADGRFGVCLDTGARSWPAGVPARSRTVTDPVVGYLLSTHLEAARRDPVAAAALWWAVGTQPGRNSGPAAVRGHLAELGRERPGVAAQVRRSGRRWVRDAVRHAAPRRGYATPSPVLGATTLSGLDLRSARGLPVPGIRVTVRLSGGATFADGHAERTVVTSAHVLPPLTWRRGAGAGAVTARVRYTRVPEHRYRLHLSGARYQRVATSAGLRRLSATVTAPALLRPVLQTRVSLQRAAAGSRIADAVTISGLGTRPLPAPLVGEWQLLGPVAAAPAPDTCHDRDWSRAPVAGSGRFRVTRDETLTLGATRVPVTGCYTYRERVLASPASAAAPWTSAGLPTETTLVTTTPLLSTTVERQRAVEGDTLSDRVTVVGLPTGPGTSGTTLTGRWQLLGPIAPDRAGRCRGPWPAAPLAAEGTFPVPLTGASSVTVRTGRSRIARGGCYTYRETLGAGPQSDAVGWTSAGLAAETAVVGPRPVAVPRHPRVDTGGYRAGRVGPDGRAVGRTAAVTMPRLRLSATLSGVGFHGSVLPAPHGVARAGQWTSGAPLDALVGTTVLTGHVSDDHDRPGAFARLAGARRGDLVRTTGPDGTTYRWRVTRIWTADRTRLPRAVFGQRVARRLVLITCTGRVTTPGGGFHYRRNLVVETEPW